ncbi:PAS domain S-box protein [Methanohalobium evestigatum]|nr:PAS domain S-box protein [Methanohalobium evestigatum]
MRKTVLDTLETGKSHYNVEASLPFMIGGCINHLTFLLSTSPIKVENESKVLVNFLDISERKKVQEDLRKEKKFFERVAETSPISITHLDKSGNIIYANHTAEKVLGLSKNDINRRTYDDVKWKITDYDGNDFPQDELPFELVKKYHQPVYDVQHAIEWKNGKRIYLSINAAPIFDKYGNFDGMIAAIEDITKQKNTESNLEHALYNSHEREKEINELLNATRTILEVNDFNTAARYIFDSCSRLLGAKAGYVSLLSDTGDENEILFLEDGGMPCSVDIDLPIPVRGLSAEVSRTGDVVYDNDFMNSNRVKYMPECHMNLPNVLISPLTVDGKTLGFMGFAYKEGGFTDNDAQLAKTFGEYAAIALKNSKAFQALEKSEERYRSIFETAASLITSVDENGTIVDCNNQIKNILGYEKEEVIGQSMTKIIHPDYVNKSFEILHEILNYGFSYNKEYKMVRKDGELIDVLINSSGVDKINGNYSRTICIINDITKSKEFEHELKKSEEKFRKVTEQAADVIIAYDFDGNILYVNNLACEKLGYTKNELLSMNITDIDPENNIETYRKYWYGLSQNNSVHIETSRKRKDGSVYPAELRMTLIDLNGKPVILGFSRDMTVQKEAEENLINAKLEAEAASQAKSDILANVNHELRTPLTSIIGFSDVLLKGKAGDLNESQKMYLSRVHNNGKHLLDLITDILDLSKIESGKSGLNYERISIIELVNDLKEYIQPFVSNKVLILHSRVDSGLNYIYADYIKIKQILSNLLYNAVKFTEEGSITLEVSQNEDDVQFSVIDTGIGIPKGSHEAIFDSFKQLDSGPARKYQGTGLGLALVNKLVNMHGGQIWVESEIKKGSRFTFTIPDNR